MVVSAKARDSPLILGLTALATTFTPPTTSNVITASEKPLRSHIQYLTGNKVCCDLCYVPAPEKQQTTQFQSNISDENTLNYLAGISVFLELIGKKPWAKRYFIVSKINEVEKLAKSLILILEFCLTELVPANSAQQITQLPKCTFFRDKINRYFNSHAQN